MSKTPNRSLFKSFFSSPQSQNVSFAPSSETRNISQEFDSSINQTTFKNSSLQLLRAKYDRQGNRVLDHTYLAGAYKVLKFMHEAWLKCNYCDIYFHCAGVGDDIPAHKIAVASYSQTLAKQLSMYPKGEIILINMEDFQREIVMVVLNFIYTTDIEICDKTVGPILSCAIELDIDILIRLCKEHLAKVDISNALEFYSIADARKFADVKANIEEFVCKHFVTVVNHDSFLLVTFDGLFRILNLDVCVRSELDVFLAIVRWIDYDRENRKQYAAQLLQQVNFRTIIPEMLATEVETHQHLFDSKTSLDLLYDAMRFHALRLSGSKLMATVEPRKVLRPGTPPKGTPYATRPSPIPSPIMSSTPIANTPRPVNVTLNMTHSNNSPFQTPKKCVPCGGNFNQCASSQYSPGLPDQTLNQQNISPAIQRCTPHNGNFTQTTSPQYSPGLPDQTPYQQNMSPPIQQCTPHNGNFNQTTSAQYSLGLSDQTPYQQNMSPSIQRCTHPSGNFNQCAGPQYSPVSSEQTLYQQNMSAPIHRCMSQSSGALKNPACSQRPPAPFPGSLHSTPQTSNLNLNHHSNQSLNLSCNQLFNSSSENLQQNHFSGGSGPTLIATGGININTDDMNTPGKCIYQLFPELNSWVLLTTLKTATHHHAATVLGGKLCVIGGCYGEKLQNKDMGAATNKLTLFDPETATWFPSTPMNQCRSYLGAASHETSIYVVGGEDDMKRRTDTVEKYDGVYNRWVYVARLRCGPKLGMAVAVYRNHLYIVGGYNRDSPGGPILPDVECLDIKSQRWVDKKALPMGRCHANLVVASGKLYLVGGRTRCETSGTMYSVASILQYDDNLDSWYHITNMETPRHDAGCSVIGRRIYIVGGMVSPGLECLKSVECFDTSTNLWVKGVAPLPSPAAGLACATL